MISIDGRGIYILILKNTCEEWVKPGSLPYTLFQQGIYAYVGSAKGPGGLARRINRHLKRHKKIKWHIDYLTCKDTWIPIAVIYSECFSCCEEALVQQLEKSGLWTHMVKGFGSSDTDAFSHFLKFKYNDITRAVKIAEKAFLGIGLKPQKIIFRKEDKKSLGGDL